MTDRGKTKNHGSKKQIHKDAEGQFASTGKGEKADGVVSAKPTVITGSQDATVHKWPADKVNPPKDWDVNFDDTAPRGDRD